MNRAGTQTHLDDDSETYRWLLSVDSIVFQLNLLRNFSVDIKKSIKEQKFILKVAKCFVDVFLGMTRKIVIGKNKVEFAFTDTLSHSLKCLFFPFASFSLGRQQTRAVRPPHLIHLHASGLWRCGFSSKSTTINVLLSCATFYCVQLRPIFSAANYAIKVQFINIYLINKLEWAATH